MTTTSSSAHYDPYDVATGINPHPAFRRLRDEAPLYYNAERDFYALSRYADVEHGLVDRDTFISGHGIVLEQIKANVELPPGSVIFEDPPAHTIHRSLLARMFTPRKVAALEPEIRQLCVDCLDPLVGSGRFDFITDLGAQMPMRVIGMLLGIPEDDQAAIRQHTHLIGAVGPQELVSSAEYIGGGIFGEYIDWRAEHPSDDIMTELMNVEFEDEHGVRRRLTRAELLTYVNIVANAGNETTTNLIGWTAKTLSLHPEQRRMLVEDRSLVPNAIEEVFRYEPPTLHPARYVARDIVYYGQTVPEGSVMLMITAAANRDERQYDEPDRFDITRKVGQHLALGFGPHYCLGASLARMEARIALEEVLERFPTWEPDEANELFVSNSMFRAWEKLPVLTS